MSESDQQEVPPIMLGGVLVETGDVRSPKRPPTPRPVVITDIQMPFDRMVIVTMKWTLASIPAMLVLALVGGMISDLLRARSR
jgi:hypothetical protein